MIKIRFTLKELDQNIPIVNQKYHNKPNNKELTWIEKYRPSSLDKLISHKDIINTISVFMTEQQLPNLLFYGPPGTGKTSTIVACAR